MEWRLNFKEGKGSRKGEADILKATSFLVLLGTRRLTLYTHFPCVAQRGGLYGTGTSVPCCGSALLPPPIERLFLKCFLLSKHRKTTPPRSGPAFSTQSSSPVILNSWETRSGFLFCVTPSSSSPHSVASPPFHFTLPFHVSSELPASPSGLDSINKVCPLS